MIIKIKKEKPAFTKSFGEAREKLFTARVVAEHKELYKIKFEEKEYFAKITGNQIFDAEKREDFPAVGDFVEVFFADKENAVIRKILPRKTILQKKYSNKNDAQIIATNIDVAFVVESLDRDYNLNRLERYFVLAKEGKIKPVVVLNKTDLVLESELFEKIKEIKNRFENADIVLTNAIKENGILDLKNYIEKEKTYCFLGSSGVGKSSLINKLLGKNKIETQEISNTTGKGKHTTTAREMYFLQGGGIVIDNPGTREVGMADVAGGIENVFEKIKKISENCRYKDCSHINEPGCAVVKAVEENILDKEQYENYLKLKKENEFYKMTDFEKKEKDKKFGKFIKNYFKNFDGKN